MLTKNLVYEIVKKNSIPLNRTKEGLSCIEYSKNVYKYKFPGGGPGLFSLFLSASYLYGFKLNVEGFKNFYLFPPHEKTCFHLQEIFKKPKEFYLEENNLKTIETYLLPSKKKLIKEKLMFIISGDFTIKGKFTIKTEKEEKNIFALTINIDSTLNLIKDLCSKALKRRIIELPYNLDLEYLTQTMLDLFQDHLWQSTIKYYKDIPIYKVNFSKTGKYKLSDFGRI